MSSRDARTGYQPGPLDQLRHPSVLATSGKQRRRTPYSRQLAGPHAGLVRRARYNLLRMFDSILLEPTQVEAFTTFVEAARSTSREKREDFWFHHTLGDVRAHVSHPALADELVHQSDIEILAREGLLLLRYERHDSGYFDITPLGYRYYEHLIRKRSKPLESVEGQVDSYLNGDHFRRLYPRAYDKWLRASRALASADAPAQLSTVGHLCREAMQEFAAELAPPAIHEAVPDKSKTVARMRALLESIRSKTEASFLEALLAYWGTVSDLVQKQEHGAERDGAPLTWQDGRRVVFHTAIVMYEYDRAITSRPAG